MFRRTLTFSVVNRNKGTSPTNVFRGLLYLLKKRVVLVYDVTITYQIPKEDIIRFKANA